MKPIFLLILSLPLAACSMPGKLNDLYWQLRLEKALGTTAAPRDDGLSPPNDPRRKLWEKRAAAAKVRMTRADVERLLPKFDWSGRDAMPSETAATKNGLHGRPFDQYQWYYIAPDFIAIFIYDGSGGLDPTGMGVDKRQTLLKSPVIVHFDFARQTGTGFGCKS